MSCYLCSKMFSDVSYPLEPLQLPASRRQAIKVMAEMLGNPYLVACEGNDVVCRSCFELLSKFDYLEQEVTGVKKEIVRFLEKKCQVEEGAFSESTQKTEEPSHKKNKFLERKRKSEEKREDDADDSDDPRSRIWMQCNSCEYTCNYTKFVERHVFQGSCKNCGVSLVGGSCPAHCSESVAVVTTAAPVSNFTVVNGTEQTIILPPTLEGEIPIVEQDGSARKAMYIRLVDNGQIIATTSSGEAIPIWDAAEVPTEGFLS